MSHHKHYSKRCKYNIKFDNEDKKLHPSHPKIIQGKVAFCEGLRAYPIGRKPKHRRK